MDGLAAMRTVLAADPALTAVIPEARIIADDVFPSDMAWPAILLLNISSIDRNIPLPGATRFVTDRIQVEVHGVNKPQVRSAMRLVRKAAADKFYPAVEGISGVTIRTDSRGPGGFSEATMMRVEQQDFKVTYLEQC